MATIDLGIIAGRRHHVASLLELDVSETRSCIRSLRRDKGISLSFNAWIIKAVSRALEDYPEAHAYRSFGRSIITFENIDVTVMVERLIEGRQVPLTYVLKNTEQKTAAEITAELETVRRSAGKDSDVVLGKKSGPLTAIYFALPGCIRRLFWRFLRYFPKAAQKQMGSAIITNVGMMGKIQGWFIPRSIHPISVGIGSVIKKPKVVKNTIEAREILHLTLLLDHDVIDGAPMARFVERLSRLIESGPGFELT